MNRLRLLKALHSNRHIKLIKMNSKYSTHPVKFMEVQEMWRQKDGVSPEWQLIYKGPMDKVVKVISTYVTITSSLFTCAGIYYATIAHKTRDLNQPILLGSSDVVIADNVYECLIYICTFVFFHILVKVFLSKYVVRLYKNGDKYIAVFRGHIYNSIKKHEFHVNDFKKLNPAMVVAWGNARYSLGGKHGIILENYFKTPEYYNVLVSRKSK